MYEIIFTSADEDTLPYLHQIKFEKKREINLLLAPGKFAALLWNRIQETRIKEHGGFKDTKQEQSSFST